MLTIQVRGLPRSMTEQALTDLFGAYGKVRSLRMARDLFTGECRGLAQLQMEGHEARAAIAALNGSSQGSDVLNVLLEEERKPRGRR